MDDSFEPDRFRERCEAWFTARYERVDPERHDPPGLIAHTGEDHDAPMRHARQHQRQLAAAGLAGLTVPVEYGGQGLPEAVDGVFASVEREYALPSMVPLSVGLSLALHTLLRFGPREMCEARIPRILDASEVWCQLFSEPDAGSDLASLTTTARRDGDGYVINGQKVWTSFAQHAAYGLLLARTGAPEQRHRGLSLFVLPMDAAGVHIRPLREMTGGTHFNEVFLDGVHLPDSSLLGGEGNGWAAAMFTLGNERQLGSQRARPRWKRIHELAGGSAGIGAAARDRAVRLAIGEQIQRLVELPGSAAKLLGAQIEVAASELAVDVLGAHGVAHESTELGEGSSRAASAAHWFLGARANRIAGGTDEIQRNVIAERVLGLPR